LALNGPTLSEPVRLFDPLQPLLAVHDVAFAVVQFSVTLAPEATCVALADSDSVGAAVGGGVVVTATDSERDAEPPAPVHVMSNVVFALRIGEVSLPEVTLLPAQPPAAVQEVAFVVLHASWTVLPAAT
jgi:hypothetical protein